MINLNYRGLLLILNLLCVVLLSAQPQAYYTSCVFNTPQEKPYLETHFTFNGKSLKAHREKQGFRNSVQILVTIMSDTSIIKISKYNLSGPFFQDAANPPAFIDVQRYSLPNGKYDVEYIITDNLSVERTELRLKDRIHIHFKDSVIESSAIQALESYMPAQKPGILTKNGYDLIPYTVNYYPETSQLLSFYVESYNSDRILGENAPFIYTYYLEMAGTGKILENYGSFKKQVSAPVTVLLAKMDISKLGSGDYNLVVEIRDAQNQLHKRTKYNFRRENRLLDVATLQSLSEKNAEAAYFGNCNNTDTLKMFVECLWPIADGIDKERIVNQAIKKDPDLMKKFVVDFWERRAADTADPVALWARYYKSVQEVMALFKCGRQKGYYSDRGRVYLQYGPPSQRSQQPNEHNTYPYEIWQYYRTTDATNGQFFSNRKFVFVNRNMGDDCHTLIHSDMRGEIYNPRWQFELTRRNNQGIASPDNTTPGGTEHNQFNDIYSNPR